MIDTHCHLLPALDDGPRDIAEATVLARGLAACGVRTVVCTPHYSRRYPTESSKARERLDALGGALEKAGTATKLSLAAEVGSAMALDAEPSELAARALANKHLLVELEPAAPAAAIELIVERLAGLGMVPVFAHPERCRAVRRGPALLDSAREAGALVQVVAPSLAGRWGDEAAVTGWSLLVDGRADILASDAHRPAHAERLSEVLESVSRRLGADALTRLTETNPALLTQQDSSGASGR